MQRRNLKKLVKLSSYTFNFMKFCYDKIVKRCKNSGESFQNVTRVSCLTLVLVPLRLIFVKKIIEILHVCILHNKFSRENILTSCTVVYSVIANTFLPSNF